MKKTSIKDIARQAGVAPSTVSCVLNGKAKERRISDKVAKRIELLAKRSGYRPNQTAVSLRTGKSKIIGLIVENISDFFFSTLAKCIEDKAYSLGYRIVYCSTENDDNKGNELIRMLLHQQVDGFLITPSTGMEKEIAGLLKNHKPVVLIDRSLPAIKIPNVVVNNYEGVKAGMNHLLKKGYSTIAFVTVDLDQTQMHDRAMAYRDTLDESGLSYSRKLILAIPYTLQKDESVKRITVFLKENPGIDAVFFATNYLGIYGLESIGLLELAIPEDIAIICFDDHDVFRIVKPRITVIAQPIAEIATTSIDILISLLEGYSVEPEEFHVVKNIELIVREST